MRTAHRIATVTAAALLGLAVATARLRPAGIDVNPGLAIDTAHPENLTATGTASCDGDGSTDAAVELRVTDGAASGKGFSGAITCDGTSHPWKLVVVAESNTTFWVRGSATAKASFTAFGTSNPSPATDTTVLTLNVALG
uniref:Secreted protein n=1 Tax=Streptomyces sp. NBC_00003 TaxID=2903608 RepID=A0AAU2UXT2_9ACTN